MATPVRPNLIVAPVELEEGLIGVQERMRQQREDQREAEMEIEEAVIPKVPARV